jgi:hypothetical protein
MMLFPKLAPLSRRGHRGHVVENELLRLFGRLAEGVFN